MSRMADKGRTRSRQRQVAVSAVAARQGGVVSRAQLAAMGLHRNDIRSEVAAGRWRLQGSATVQVGDLTQPGRLWRGLFETSKHGRFDGVTALQLAGLTGWESRTIDVVVPHNRSYRAVEGVRVFVERDLEPCLSTRATDAPRSEPAYALVRAAMSSDSDRQAATLLAMTVQQRIVAPDRLLEIWNGWRLPRRRMALEPLIRDVCDGAHSLGELDFARLCRERGLPEPTRQAVCKGPDGRVFLDVRWECGLVVEIDGVQHFQGLAPVDDALRQNTITLRSDTVLRIPVLGLRLYPDRFLDQVAAGLRLLAA